MIIIIIIIFIIIIINIVIVQIINIPVLKFARRFIRYDLPVRYGPTITTTTTCLLSFCNCSSTPWLTVSLPSDVLSSRHCGVTNIYLKTFGHCDWCLVACKKYTDVFDFNYIYFN